MPRRTTSKPGPASPWGIALAGDIPDALTDAELVRTQEVLGVTLPAEYVEALRVRNGGQLRHTCFKLSPGAAKIHGRKRYSLRRLAGAHPTHADGLTQLTALARDEWDLAPGLIPLDGDGHAWCCLDYRSGGAGPRITHVSTDGGGEFTVAESFKDLLGGLYTDVENMTPALLALDEGSPRGAALGGVLLSLGCTVYGYPGLVSHPDNPPPPTWHWAEYRGLLRKSPVWISAEPNKLYRMSLMKTPLRPKNHPMLCVAVHPSDAEACLARLAGALGPHAVLIHGVQ